MDSYNYKAIDADGMTRTGILSAKSEQEILNILRDKNQMPISIKKMEASSSMNVEDSALFKKKVKLVDISVFCRQLSAMMKAGMPLDRAISTQINQTENPTLKEALTQVSAQVKQGIPLSRAMKEHPKVFPKLLGNMVESGEVTGDMDGALYRMALHFEKENKINKRVKGAMIYPAVLLFLTFAVAIGMLIFVIPTFSQMFTAAGNDMPGLTQMMLDASNALRTYWYAFLGGLIAVVYLIRRWLNSKSGRYTFDGWKLRLPIIKKPMQQIITARFTRTLSTMLSSGISLISAMQSAAETANNAVLVEKIETVSEDLKRGSPLTMQLRKTGLFPEMMLSMIGIGEETGEMDDMLAKTADYYEEEFDSAIGKMLSLLEPCLIILMAGVVGFIVIAMYLPIFELTSNVM